MGHRGGGDLHAECNLGLFLRKAQPGGIKMLRWITLIFTVGFAQPVVACIAADFEDHHYPSCTIPEPQSDARVTLLSSHVSANLADHHVGDPDKQTRLVTVEIADSETSHYLVLSAFGQTIWQFEGAVESIDRIVVLGAHTVGPEAAGVIGVAAEKISFTAPDMSLLDVVPVTSCTRISQSCTTAQWFSDRRGDRVTYHPEPTQGAIRFDETVNGNTPRRLLETEKQLITLVHPENPDAVIAIDPAQVVTPASVLPYAQMPGQPGLDALVAAGSLIPADTPQARAMIARYAEAFGARYRSRFDPDFLFEPEVDYIVTEAVRLPPQLRPTALLVASGVPAPDMNGNDGYVACYYLEDQAAEVADGDVIRSSRCRLNTRSRAIGAGEDILRGARDFDRAIALTTGDCRNHPLADDVHRVAVALAEGPNRRYRGDPHRQIDIDVTRDGPTALYLTIEGGPTRWIVTGADVVEIFASRAGMAEMVEVVLNGEPYEAKQLRNSDGDCNVSAPIWPNRLGPDIAHLDFAFDVITGGPLDVLITDRFAGTAAVTAGATVPFYEVQ